MDKGKILLIGLLVLVGIYAVLDYFKIISFRAEPSTIAFIVVGTYLVYKASRK